MTDLSTCGRVPSAVPVPLHQMSQQYCLRWNNHQHNLLSVFEDLLHHEAFVDVTLACQDGLHLKAHKMVLSACSPYFQSILYNTDDRHPIVLMRDVTYIEMKSLLEFMYRGEVSIHQENLSSLLSIAEVLKIKGLADVNLGSQIEPPIPASIFVGSTSTSENPISLSTLNIASPSKRVTSPSASSSSSSFLGPKRKRGRPRRLSGSEAIPMASDLLQTERDLTQHIKTDDTESDIEATICHDRNRPASNLTKENENDSFGRIRDDTNNEHFGARTSLVCHSSASLEGKVGVVEPWNKMGNGGLFGYGSNEEPIDARALDNKRKDNNNSVGLSSSSSSSNMPWIKMGTIVAAHDKFISSLTTSTLRSLPVTEIHSSSSSSSSAPFFNESLNLSTTNHHDEEYRSAFAPPVGQKTSSLGVSSKSVFKASRSRIRNSRSVAAAASSRRMNYAIMGDPKAMSEMSVRGLDLLKYSTVDPDGTYKCNECDKQRVVKNFKNKYSFQRHAFLYHEGASRKVFPCSICHREFSRPDKMKQHLKTVHDCVIPVRSKTTSSSPTATSTSSSWNTKVSGEKKLQSI